MAHYALLDIVTRQRKWDRRHPYLRARGEALNDGSEDSPLDQARDDPASDPVQMAEWAGLHERVERLPQPLRDVFTRRFYLGLPQSEIAERMGLHPRQVSRLWAEAVATLGDVIDLED